MAGLTTDWHEIIALALVFVAAVVVGRRAYRAVFASGKAGCGTGCGSCRSESSKSPSGKLLHID